MNYEEVMKLALERGFYFPSCEVYSDANAGFWEYGPSGVSLKNKFLELWRRELIRRDGMMEIDGSQIMSKSVFEASGHLGNFADPIIKCTKCNSTYRADRTIAEIANIEIPESADLNEFDNAIKENKIQCPKCKGDFSATKKFNMMFKVGIGPQEEEAYLRPETCQSIFVDFPRLFKTMRGKLPLGIAQVGKSFRNEIAPRQSLLRLREFYQAEIEVFCNPGKLNEVEKFSEIENTLIRVQTDADPIAMTCKEAVESGAVPNKFVAYYLGILTEFYEKTGIDISKSRFRKLGDKEKAFYAEVAFDFEIETTIGWLELVACNYRADYDLSNHAKMSKEKFEVMDNDEKVLPHVFEISMGIDRSLYTILEHSLKNDEEHERMVLSLKPYLSPIHVGILSLVKKDGLKEKTDEIFNNIKRKFDAFLDHSGAIGRRYRRLDEIGAPFAITVDHQTLEDNTVTIRKRDSMEQSRIDISKIDSILLEAVGFP
ncbi:MAG: glycine--tRNA ligase [Candidatus Nitrosopumilus limneticus]|nr:Glycyl-tRNA synthetase [Candidatus Nitrosopumilus limneticus]MDA0668532.1 glycine--tRNA ligase [Thermoproteota archaeon]HJJ21239.1 glycine--tRNA ligase [Nitrosopumilus sp.]MDA0853558.1 glycine--tRNA ligase [Thermoproteota archaeon]MDA1123230.1 glycine--tRNA ligase [Thermoproteota archaeon]